MKYISFPNNTERKLPFYLSAEEYVARYLDGEDAFFMWRVASAVLIGRNQLSYNEINTDYVRDKEIGIYRRKSGGGCIYVDPGTVMFSYITTSYNVGSTFNKHLENIASSLKLLGIAAEVKGRNDILIDGKKVSGNAFYRAAGKSIVHGTILFETDLENLVKSLTPNNEKLISKGIESTRKRVTNLSEHLDMKIDDFMAFLRTHLCNSEYILSEEELSVVENIEQEYLNDNFIFGNNPRYSLVKKEYSPIGDIEIRMELKNNIIKDMNVVGDYFLIGDLDNGLLKRIVGQPYERKAVTKILENVVLEDYIHNLTKDHFLEIMFQEN